MNNSASRLCVWFLLLFVSVMAAAIPQGDFALGASRRYEGPMTDAHAHQIQWSSDWVIKTLDVYQDVGVDKVILFDGDEPLEAYRLRPNQVIPSIYVREMNLPTSITKVESALKRGFMWIGEALLRHWGETNTPADDPVALQIYDLCAKYRVPITVHQDSGDYRGAYKELEKALDHSPTCIFVFHGWWMGTGHLTIVELERMILAHPNLYVELAGELEDSEPPWTEQTFLDGTGRDLFAYPDGTIKGSWRQLFERYPTRFINGFDLFTKEAFTLKNLSLRADYWRRLLGQISYDAAEKIAYKNVENLLSRETVVNLMTIDLSSSFVTAQDRLMIAAELRNLQGDPIADATINFSLESIFREITPIGTARTDTSGHAELTYVVNVSPGIYDVIASYEGSDELGKNSGRTVLHVEPALMISTMTATSAVAGDDTASTAHASASALGQEIWLQGGLPYPVVVVLLAAFVLVLMLRRSRVSSSLFSDSE